jgi:nucleotide-binding universal stress UspA family protein
MTITQAHADANSPRTTALRQAQSHADIISASIASSPPWCTPSRIVVATDLSPVSRTSFGCASALACSFDASLTLLHVSRPRLGEAVRRAQHEQLAREHCALQACGASAETALSAARTPWRAIVAYGDHCEADCLIVAHQGAASDAERMRLSRTASRLVRYSRAAVLVARPSAGGRSAWSVRRVVVPLDFSLHSAMALAAAVEWSAKIQAPLHAVHVLRRPPMMPSSSIGLREWLRELTEMAAERLRDVVEMHPTAPITTRVMLGDSIALTLVDALLTPEDIVLMSSQGMGARRTRTNNTKVGSTAERVLALAPCSVVTFNPAALARLCA